jgi:hypothetical protein
MLFRNTIATLVISLGVLVFSIIAIPATSFAATPCGSKASGTQYTPAIDIGCQSKGNAIDDMLFAIIRILSDGVGLVVIGSIIVAGIQYTTSQGNPQNTAKAVARVRSSIIALLIYIFGYAILNYLIPAGFLH